MWTDIHKIKKQDPLLGVGKTYVICKNQMDALHWQLAFQDNINSCLVGYYFVTIPQCFHDTIKLINPFHQKTAITKIQYTYIVSYLTHKIWKSVAFTFYVQEIIEILLWYPEQHADIYSNIKKEYRENIKLVMSELQAMLEKHSLFLETEYLTMSPTTFVQNKQQRDTIIWCDPGYINHKDKKRIEVLDATQLFDWHIFVNPNTPSSTLHTCSAINNITLYKKKATRHSIKVNDPDWHRYNIELPNPHANHTRENKNSLRIWLCNSEYTQAHMAVQTIYELTQKYGIQLYDMMILYTSPIQYLYITMLLNRIHLPFQSQTQPKNIVSYSVSTIFNHLLHVLKIDKIDKHLYIDSDIFFSFWLCPQLNISFFTKKTSKHKYNQPSSWLNWFNRYIRIKQFTLHEFIKMVQTYAKAHPKDILHVSYFLTALKTLDSIRQNLEDLDGQNLIQYLTELLYNIFDTSNVVVENQIKEMEHILQDLYTCILQTNIAIEKSTFYTFLQITFQAIQPKHNHNHMFYHKQDQSNEYNKWNLNIQSIHDAIPSCIQYVIICAQMDEHITEPTKPFFQLDYNTDRCALSLTHTVKKQQLSESILFSGTHVIYLDTIKTTYRHDSIIRHLTEYLFPSLPFHEFLKYLPSISLSLGQEVIYSKLHTNLEYTLRRHHTANVDSKEILLSYKQAHHIIQARFVQQTMNQFTGQTNRIRTESNHHVRATNISQIAACPQQYWFDRVLGLNALAPVEHIEGINFSLQGQIFHQASKYFIMDLQERYPKKNYKFIANNIQDNVLFNKISLAAFTQAWQEFTSASEQAYYSTPVETQVTQQYITFTNFFYFYFSTIQYGDSPINEYIPIATEYEFQDIIFANLKVSGRIDRIDYNPMTKNLLVVDYKMNDKSNHVKIKNQTMLGKEYIQLLVYLKVVAQDAKNLLSHLPNGSVEQVEAMFLSVKKRSEIFPKQILSFPLIDVLSDRYMTNISITPYTILEPEIKFGLLLNRVKKVLDDALFYAIPYEKDQEPCCYCNFMNICDKEPTVVALDRLQNHWKTHSTTKKEVISNEQ